MSLVSDIAAENYLKTVVKALARSRRERVGTGELSRLLHVTPGTISTMVKRLEKGGYVQRTHRLGCTLTRKGAVFGSAVLRKHRLLESFLSQVLCLEAGVVHKEAEMLEHACSDELIDVIDRYLQYPTRDPHGQPIPRKDTLLDLYVEDDVPGV
ncbi:MULTISPECIES: manganese/iron-sensitive transcriptional repressor TroR [Treponema]|uniref:Transcriptional regulator MntR n=7 Tax=Treponema TaxID=157 RepID=F7IW50_TREPA|nr:MULTISPECIES: manganese/iron-sensitive transcriptional repressor TroR [Treponema]AAC45729.1 TroR [Treponema pallidum subsp. pallidum]AAC65157.1 cation-activated repressor protein (troR) [Treponema pallidum subsp. pallidum str. Nichols]ACD70593.1 cation-activated repressor protein [Treponema pallidum subsp. pallidum SS14]ADD72318.1 cation-activated repressor protein [Treponema pallidum subsp. pallidum str. Chicago]AEH40122.1 iron (Fe2+)/zinc (Zn2+)/manganese (Mn2+)-dependent transcriptional 